MPPKKGVAATPKGNLDPVKLCRFELKDQPGEVRSGIVYGAKIYETDGVNAIATYEAPAVRPLAPVGTPPSLRFFDLDRQMEGPLGAERLPLSHSYGNPAALHGPSTIVPCPAFAARFGIRPYIGVVISQPGYGFSLEDAEDFVLGYTLCLALVALDVERDEHSMGIGPGRSRDFGVAIGPVLTTPEELDEAVVKDDFGKVFELEATLKINGVDSAKSNLREQPRSFAEAITCAAESCMLRAGDLLAVGPSVSISNLPEIEPGDEIQLAVERLGMLSLKTSS